MTGRQLAIVMNLDDEREFVSFLRSSADIKLIESFAPSIRELWVDEINPIFTGHHTYHIWNCAYGWKPNYGTVGEKAYDRNSIGWRYVSNKSDAPLLELTRSNIVEGKIGRLYWAKDFSSPKGLRYDSSKFGRWIDNVWRWIRKYGKKESSIIGDPYFLPGAWTLRRSP
jgi:hypothetical protein